MKYVRVAVEKANYSFDTEFTYSVPGNLEDRVRPGCMVTVPFGNGNRKSLGIVFEVSDTAPQGKIKKISELRDEEPLLSAEMIELARYIKNKTFCTLYEAAKAMLPAGINFRIVKFYASNPDVRDEELAALNDEEREIYSFLSEKNDFVKEDLIFRNLSREKDPQVLDRLAKKNILISRADAVRNLSDLTAKMVRPLPEEDFARRLSKKQQEVYDILTDAGAASVKEICYFTGYTPAVVGALVKNGAAEYFETEIDYFSDYGLSEGVRTHINLTSEQKAASEKLTALAFSGKRAVSLLYGVTGSGKTSVYMSVMDAVVDSGRCVILLVPEIGLTPQAMNIFCARYGKNVAIFHSALSVRERREQWKRVRKGEAKIVIGTRSAVFAPVENVGLIIIDEEQEHTYKSEQTPRYDAADVAKFRCAYNNSLLILASATPRVESYAAALKGKYELCTLSARYGSALLPEVQTVDMRTAEKMPGCSEVSRELYEGLNECIQNGRQAILLINRRGYNTFAVCDDCGKVMTCPQCSISLTYHRANNRLICHYCGYSAPFTGVCPECGESAVRYAGYGTQKIEDELSKLLPEAKILRMDADTTTSKDSHEKLFSAFERGEYNILLGTQMVAKGLDFPNVTLVGVVSVDQQLYNDDFRSLEKTFSLLTQVVGRSGRGESQGRAIIQTLTPENEIIRIAARQDYDEFFESEIRIRRAMTYPPYCDLCVLGLTGEDEQGVRIASNEVLSLIRTLISEKYKGEKIIVLGPVPARVLRVSGKYRYRIIIKCRNSADFRAMISEVLIETGTDKRFRNVSVFADMNPDSAL